MNTYAYTLSFADGHALHGTTLAGSIRAATDRVMTYSRMCGAVSVTVEELA